MNGVQEIAKINKNINKTKKNAPLNDIKNSVSYYLYLYINLSPYQLVSAIAKKGD
jgi:hypothetical protein